MSHRTLGRGTCQMCGGDGLIGPVRGGDGVPLTCPVCAATYLPTRSSEVQWNESIKSFDIALAFDLEPQADPIVAGALASWVSANSQCSCGSHLSVSDHAMTVEGRDALFIGRFFCPRCKAKAGGGLNTLRRVIATIWTQLMSVKIGPDGLEITKQPPAK